MVMVGFHGGPWDGQERDIPHLTPTYVASYHEPAPAPEFDADCPFTSLVRKMMTCVYELVTVRRGRARGCAYFSPDLTKRRELRALADAPPEVAFAMRAKVRDEVSATKAKAARVQVERDWFRSYINGEFLDQRAEPDVSVAMINVAGVDVNVVADPRVPPSTMIVATTPTSNVVKGAPAAQAPKATTYGLSPLARDALAFADKLQTIQRLNEEVVIRGLAAGVVLVDEWRLPPQPSSQQTPRSTTGQLPSRFHALALELELNDEERDE